MRTGKGSLHLFAHTVLVLALVLSACAPQREYRDDRSAVDLADVGLTSVRSASDAAPDTVYLRDESDLLASYFDLPDYVPELCVLYAQEIACLDEVGVFHVTDGASAASLASLLHDAYLRPSYERNRDWYNSYMPHETPKLRDAEVRVFGNYVAYAILSPASRAAFFSAIEAALSENAESLS